MDMEFYWEIIDKYTIILYSNDFDFPLVQAHYEENEGFWYISGVNDDFYNYEFVVEDDDYENIKELKEIITEDLIEFCSEEAEWWKDITKGLKYMNQ